MKQSKEYQLEKGLALQSNRGKTHAGNTVVVDVADDSPQFLQNLIFCVVPMEALLFEGDCHVWDVEVFSARKDTPLLLAVQISGRRCAAIPLKTPATPQKLEFFFRHFSALNLTVIDTVMRDVNVDTVRHLINYYASLYVSSGVTTLAADVCQSASRQRRHTTLSPHHTHHSHQHTRHSHTHHTRCSSCCPEP